MFSSASNARRDAARQAAERARNAAADAFLALDDAQQGAAMVVEAYVRLEPGAEGARAQAEWRPLSEASDVVSQRWIDTLDAYRRAMDDPEAEPRALQDAERAFRAALPAIEAARTPIEALAARNQRLEQRIATAWSRVTPKRQAATDAVAAARAAVAAARAAGVVSAELDQRLGAVEEASRRAADVANAHSVEQTIASCDAAVAAAQELSQRAAALGKAVAQVAGRLGTTRTRLQGMEVRAERLEPTLSELRRRYSVACSVDLDHLPVDVSRAVDDAKRLLAEATALLDRDKATAAARLDDCRRRLADAESGIDKVVDRLRDLDAVAEDPAAARDKARFRVRDAQQLVVSAGTRAPANERSVLDSLAARLDRVAERLGKGAHPDYWSYLVELRAITEVADGVVRRTRAALAG